MFRLCTAALESDLPYAPPSLYDEFSMIRANCRARFTAADFDFVVRTLARCSRAGSAIANCAITWRRCSKLFRARTDYK